MPSKTDYGPVDMEARAARLKKAGGLARAIEQGSFKDPITVPLAEALVLGLMRQGITKYLAIFGHGSTAISEVLRVYAKQGLVRCWPFRNEVEMAHAGTALRWVYGETCALVTSIGPGAFQAMAGSLAAASNGVGIYHIYGDETTHGEGYNMQQVPKAAQGLFGQITGLMGQAYTLHTPAALRDALRKGASAVFHPWRPAPFYLNMPINTQPQETTLLPQALPTKPAFAPAAPVDAALFAQVLDLITRSSNIAVKLGGGSVLFADRIQRFVDQIGAVAVQSPISTGTLPDAHPQNMHVGGSKGSISGNFAMERADLLIALGCRAVCQSDCSGVGWPRVKNVININADPVDVMHYNRTLALCGDAGAILDSLMQKIQGKEDLLANKQAWLAECRQKKEEWRGFKDQRYKAQGLMDPVWGRAVLTQPQAIKITADFCKEVDAVKFFDAGDVQANGFQIVEDDSPERTFTEAGASYMGFAPSALLSTALADEGLYSVAFAGDGSFMMNPQALIDGVEHGVHGTIVVFDNRRMSAISHLQLAQYGEDFCTSDSVEVDYVKMASSVKGVLALFGGFDAAALAQALKQAYAHPGLSLVHVPVYYGKDPLGGMGAYGQWNVGSWCQDVQDQYVHTEI